MSPAPIALLLEGAAAAFGDLVRARSVEPDEDARDVGAAVGALVVRLAALRLAIGRRLVGATTLAAALEELASHDLFRFGARGPFEGVAPRAVDDAFARVAAFEDAPLEALGAAYEQLVGVGFSRAGAPTVVVDGRAFDLAELAALAPSRRAAHVEALLGVAPGARVARRLAEASTIAALALALGARADGDVVPAGGLVVERTLARRRAGSHYTPAELAKMVADAALAPLLEGRRPLDLRICDPAMGAGALLFAAARALEAAGAKRGDVVSTCLFGIDRDPRAIAVARFGLWLFAGDRGASAASLEAHLRVGDALAGAPSGDVGATGWLDFERDAEGAVSFPDIDARGGFDAVIGNPPWVAYAGRAAQPLDERERRSWARRFRSFAGYRTLHGLFVERAAEMTRPGGRVGLVLPTSVADLAGYAKVRAAHDALAAADLDLPDFGADRFEGVFQPAMALLSTRRAVAIEPSEAPWSLASAALPPRVAALVARLVALEPLPAAIFGERGVQTEGDDVTHLVEADAPRPPHTFAVREGRDVGPFRARPPRLHLDPSRVRARLRPPEDWCEVRILIRQTARYPMAALGDGAPFRNSVLAAFEHAAIDTFALLAYLNASPVRWLHFVRFRDARQGMPQLKIAHLRAIPMLPRRGDAHGKLAAIGRALGERNAGLDRAEAERLDALVADALDLDADARAIVARWSRENPVPAPRG